MPRAGIGFGADSFGRAPFGEAWWTKRLLWEYLPDRVKLADVSGDLEAFQDTVGDALARVRRLARHMPDLRDARTLRTRHNERVALTGVTYSFTSAEDSADGLAYVTATVSDGRILLLANTSWSVDDGATSYSIREFRKTDDEFDFYADAVPSSSSIEVYPPSLLGHLGFDFGVTVDGHEPEVNQRSSVYDHHKLLDLKGTADGIRLRAKMAGFAATIQSLYRTEKDWTSTLGADRVWEIPDGSGKFYTDIPPYAPMYDAIPADVIPLDQFNNCDVTESAGTITTVTGTAGAWVVTFSTSISMVVSEHWYFTLDSDVSSEPTRFYTTNQNPGAGTVTVYSQTQPSTGAVTWKLYCRTQTSCGYCKSYKIRIELEIEDPALMASPRALEGAFRRMQAKVAKMLPAHVEVSQYVYTTSHEASAEVSSPSVAQILTYTRYDDEPADTQPADQYTVTET